MTVKSCCFFYLLYTEVEPRPNDGNISTQHIPTIVGPAFASSGETIATFKNATGPTDRNIVGRNMMHAFVAIVWPGLNACQELGLSLPELHRRNIEATSFSFSYATRKKVKRKQIAAKESYAVIIFSPARVFFSYPSLAGNIFFLSCFLLSCLRVT